MEDTCNRFSLSSRIPRATGKLYLAKEKEEEEEERRRKKNKRRKEEEKGEEEKPKQLTVRENNFITCPTWGRISF